MNVRLYEPPFSEAFLSEFVRLNLAVFGEGAGQDWLDKLGWRLENMPDVTVFIAEAEIGAIGFKAGYAEAFDRYYSWLGGVVPTSRLQGVATKLMRTQHDWLAASRFNLVETHVEQANKAMIDLNMKSGLAVTGMYMKGDKPFLIMQKATPVT